jgi:DNA-binding MarR family transcriptional regulator
MAAKALHKPPPPTRERKSALPASPSAADGARPEHLEIRIWLRLLGCSSRIESALQRRIVGTFGISLARFDLLAQIERAGGVLTMSDASRRMMVTNGAITGLADRLVDEGFVVREAHPTDRRTILIRLTEPGRARFLAMAREHEIWTASLLSGLDPAAKEQLFASLGALKRQLDSVESSL